MTEHINEVDAAEYQDNLILYEDALHEWHRCVAIEESNPEAFGLAETAQEWVREYEARLSEPEVAMVQGWVNASLVFDEDAYITEL